MIGVAFYGGVEGEDDSKIRKFNNLKIFQSSGSGEKSVIIKDVFCKNTKLINKQQLSENKIYLIKFDTIMNNEIFGFEVIDRCTLVEYKDSEYILYFSKYKGLTLNDAYNENPKAFINYLKWYDSDKNDMAYSQCTEFSRFWLNMIFGKANIPFSFSDFKNSDYYTSLIDTYGDYKKEDTFNSGTYSFLSTLEVKKSNTPVETEEENITNINKSKTTEMKKRSNWTEEQDNLLYYCYYLPLSLLSKLLARTESAITSRIHTLSAEGELLENEVNRHVVNSRVAKLPVNLKGYMREYKVTQRDMGEACGVSAHTISKFVNEGRKPKLNTYIRLINIVYGRKIVEPEGVPSWSLNNLISDSDEPKVIKKTRGTYNRRRGAWSVNAARELAAELDAFRSENGLTLADIANACDISQSGLSKYIRGIYNPVDHKLDQIRAFIDNYETTSTPTDAPTPVAREEWIVTAKIHTPVSEWSDEVINTLRTRAERFLILKGYTQGHFAELCGVSPATISRFISGKTPTISKLNAIKAYLDNVKEPNIEVNTETTPPTISNVFVSQLVTDLTDHIAKTGTKQFEIAEAVGISPSGISALLSGRIIPAKGTLVNLRTYLDTFNNNVETKSVEVETPQESSPSTPEVKDNVELLLAEAVRDHVTNDGEKDSIIRRLLDDNAELREQLRVAQETIANNRPPKKTRFFNW